MPTEERPVSRLALGEAGEAPGEARSGPSTPRRSDSGPVCGQKRPDMTLASPEVSAGGEAGEAGEALPGFSRACARTHAHARRACMREGDSGEPSPASPASPPPRSHPQERPVSGLAPGEARPRGPLRASPGASPPSPPRRFTDEELGALPRWARPRYGSHRSRWAVRTRELVAESPLRDLPSAALQARLEIGGWRP